MSSGFNSYKKYLKFFSVRFVQALIQSRLGDEVESKCDTFAEAQDWFNTKIDELGEISAYLRSHIKQYPPLGTLTLEFLLFHPSGQCLPLEAWVLSATSSPERDDGCPLNELYHQMSTLLRSAIVSSRMTPMHRLYVKKQNQESFIIMYRVFQNQESSDMGKGKKVRKIGELVSQYGNITLELHYRTTMHFEEPEFAPETPVEDDEEAEIEDGDKTVVEESTGTPRAVSECVPITDARKQRKASGSADSGGSSMSREAVPRFILGQSTSSEDSRHSDGPHSFEDEHKPSLADLRNHSFPFVNLLQSAYNPANGTKKNGSSSSLNTPAPVPEEEEKEAPPTVEKVVESFRAAKINEVVVEEDEEEEEVPLDSMELSEDSFVHFNQLSEIGTAPSIGNELGDYLKQLKTAPDMFQLSELDLARTDLKTELEKISAHSVNFDKFISHINSMADE